jgi:hypothetical protein
LPRRCSTSPESTGRLTLSSLRSRRRRSAGFPSSELSAASSSGRRSYDVVIATVSSPGTLPRRLHHGRQAVVYPRVVSSKSQRLHAGPPLSETCTDCAPQPVSRHRHPSRAALSETAAGVRLPQYQSRQSAALATAQGAATLAPRERASRCPSGCHAVPACVVLGLPSGVAVGRARPCASRPPPGIGPCGLDSFPISD